MEATMNVQRAAIIGMGFISTAHLEALWRLGVTVSIVGLSSASSAHGVQALPDWQAAVADANVTMIHNCSPNHLHSQIKVAALEGGKHVFSSKTARLYPRGNRAATRVADLAC